MFDQSCRESGHDLRGGAASQRRPTADSGGKDHHGGGGGHQPPGGLPGRLAALLVAHVGLRQLAFLGDVGADPVAEVDRRHGQVGQGVGVDVPQVAGQRRQVGELGAAVGAPVQMGLQRQCVLANRTTFGSGCPTTRRRKPILNRVVWSVAE